MKANANKQKISELIATMKADSAMEEILVSRNGKMVNLGLVNQFKLHTKIPNKWFDWERSANAKIMVIGQDWGPYSALQGFISDFDQAKYQDDEYYRDFLFKGFTSKTEKFILQTIESSYLEKFSKPFTRDKWDSIFFTMAVVFTRQGKHFRGNHNFDPVKSAKLSYKYLAAQIDVVKPELIITLGNLAFGVVNQYFNLGYNNPKISSIVNELDEKYFIDTGTTKILPNFHPAAYIDPKIQKNIWAQAWEVVAL